MLPRIIQSRPLSTSVRFQGQPRRPRAQSSPLRTHTISRQHQISLAAWAWGAHQPSEPDQIAAFYLLVTITAGALATGDSNANSGAVASASASEAANTLRLPPREDRRHHHPRTTRHVDERVWFGGSKRQRHTFDWQHNNNGAGKGDARLLTLSVAGAGFIVLIHHVTVGVRDCINCGDCLFRDSTQEHNFYLCLPSGLLRICLDNRGLGVGRLDRDLGQGGASMLPVPKTSKYSC